MRYVFIDRISSLTPGESLRAVKNVTATDDLVTRHAPGVWVFPAVAPHMPFNNGTVDH